MRLLGKGRGVFYGSYFGTIMDFFRDGSDSPSQTSNIFHVHGICNIESKHEIEICNKTSALIMYNLMDTACKTPALTVTARRGGEHKTTEQMLVIIEEYQTNENEKKLVTGI